MNIGRISQVLDAYKPQPVRKPVQKKASSGIDEVQISREGLEFDYAKKLAAQISDVREDRVAAAMKRMENGKQDVSVPAVAQKILESI